MDTHLMWHHQLLFSHQATVLLWHQCERLKFFFVLPFSVDCQALESRYCVLNPVGSNWVPGFDSLTSSLFLNMLNESKTNSQFNIFLYFCHECSDEAHLSSPSIRIEPRTSGTSLLTQPFSSLTRTTTAAQLSKNIYLVWSLFINCRHYPLSWSTVYIN